MALWTKQEEQEYEALIISEYRRALDRVRKCGALPDDFEEYEPASVHKFAVRLIADGMALSDRAKKEWPNVRRMA